MPWLLVSEDGHAWSWSALQHATIRLTQHGTKLRLTFLSPHGLAAMVDILGLTW